MPKEIGHTPPGKNPKVPIRKRPPFEPEHIDPPPRDAREAPAPTPNGKPERAVDSDG
jgi:hypothetical protein